MTPETFKRELSSARSLLQIDSLTPLPIGVGFLSWLFEKQNSPHPELLSIALENNVQAVWFAFGNEIGRWIQLVRAHDQKSGKNRKTLVFVQISSLQEALVAIHDWKVDVIVAQGSILYSMPCPRSHRTLVTICILQALKLAVTVTPPLHRFSPSFR